MKFLLNLTIDVAPDGEEGAWYEGALLCIGEASSIAELCEKLEALPIEEEKDGVIKGALEDVRHRASWLYESGKA